MRRKIERCTKARLSFSGGPHTVNMADSIENAGSWTVSGSREAMSVPKNFKDLRKLRVRNIAQYNAAQVPFPAFFPTDIHFFHTIRHVYRSMWPAREAKSHFGAELERSTHDCETGLYICPSPAMNIISKTVTLTNRSVCRAGWSPDNINLTCLTTWEEKLRSTVSKGQRVGANSIKKLQV